MKKSLIALAASGVVMGGAQAQSSVTLYGKIDLSLMRNKPLGGVSQVTIDSGTISGSRWGLMGSEDLGGGLKVNFDLEQGFRADSGAAAMPGVAATPGTVAVPGIAAVPGAPAVPGETFSRQSWVGLSAGFGELRIGKPWTAYDDVSGAINSLWDSGFSVENNFFASTGYAANPANTVRYSTPSLGGFSAAASYSLDEVRFTDMRVTSISGQYAGGPVMVGVGYQVEELGGTNRKYSRLSASYDFGSAVLKALYGNVKSAASAKTNEYSLGVDVPLGEALSLSAGYGYSKDNVAAGNEKRKGFALGAMYLLSKRSDVYVAVTDWDGRTGGTKTSGNTKYGLGMRHTF